MLDADIFYTTQYDQDSNGTFDTTRRNGR